MNWRLELLILAQAIEDIVAYEFDKPISEEDLDSAEVHLSAYPELLTRVWEKKDLEGWVADINQAREELAEALKESRK